MVTQIVYVVSDSLGDTGEHVLRATLSQFEEAHVVIKRFPYIEHTSDLDRMLIQAELDEAMIIFTLVIPEWREYLLIRAAESQLIAYDLMGPLLKTFEQRLGKPSITKPGIQHRMDDHYFKKMDAVEFAVKYDDGRDAKGLQYADVVLLGVSRTSKTPLSMYLATKALKVMNVPLVPEVKLMPELLHLNPQKIIGLRIDPHVLLRIRRERLEGMGLDEHATYANLQRITYELEYAEQIMKKIGCVVIDISNRAVEEVSGKILRLFS
jgi:regulator of PEP synthase PpsR (kinase-PPPase family)